MNKTVTYFKMYIIAFLAIILLPHTTRAQMHIYLGQGIGLYQYFQGPLETRAFEFNNSTDVTQVMNADRTYRGITFGTYVNAGRITIGLDWAGKKNTLNGTRESSSGKTTDQFTEKLNTFYINFGLGNQASRDKKLIWRIQTSIGYYKLKLLDEIKGSPADFKGELGKATGLSCRNGINIWYPIFKKININVMPYYEFDIGGGYVEVLQNKIQNSEFFNINTYGININLDYAF